MTKQELINWLVRHGYAKDNYGHYQKVSDSTGKHFRMKLQDISLRYEKQINIGGKNEWMRISSAYLKDLSITNDDKLSGLKY